MITKEQENWINNQIYILAPIQPRESEFCKKRKAKLAALRNQIKEKLIKDLQIKTGNNGS